MVKGLTRNFYAQLLNAYNNMGIDLAESVELCDGGGKGEKSGKTCNRIKIKIN